MDTIANFLTSLRNAEAAKHSQLVFPASKSTSAILEIFKKYKYVGEFSTEGSKTTVALKPATLPRSYRRVSKPGRRLYVQADTIPVVKNGKGMVVLSTSHGVMSGSEARKQGLGGEIICEVY